jgi:hypothetical protein
MADLSPAAGPAGQAAVAEGAAAAATAKVGMEVAGDEDMEDPLEVHGATDEALAAAAVQAPAAAGLAGTVIHGTEVRLGAGSNLFMQCGACSCEAMGAFVRLHRVSSQDVSTMCGALTGNRPVNVIFCMCLAIDRDPYTTC